MAYFKKHRDYQDYRCLGTIDENIEIVHIVENFMLIVNAINKF